MEAGLTAHWLFCPAEHNPARSGGKCCDDSTVPDHQTRLKAFAAFVAVTEASALGVASLPSNPLDLLFATSNCTALTAFLDVLAARNVGPGGRAGYCNSVISYLKVVFADPSSSPEAVAVITLALAATQRVRSALQCQYDAEPRSGGHDLSTDLTRTN
jgi:hypothetical protein